MTAGCTIRGEGGKIGKYLLHNKKLDISGGREDILSKELSYCKAELKFQLKELSKQNNNPRNNNWKF